MMACCCLRRRRRRRRLAAGITAHCRPPGPAYRSGDSADKKSAGCTSDMGNIVV